MTNTFQMCVGVCSRMDPKPRTGNYGSQKVVPINMILLYWLIGVLHYVEYSSFKDGLYATLLFWTFAQKTHGNYWFHTFSGMDSHGRESEFRMVDIHNSHSNGFRLLFNWMKFWTLIIYKIYRKITLSVTLPGWSSSQVRLPSIAFWLEIQLRNYMGIGIF